MYNIATNMWNSHTAFDGHMDSLTLTAFLRRRRAYRFDIIRLVDVRGLVKFRNIEPNSKSYIHEYDVHTWHSVVLTIRFYRYIYIYSKNSCLDSYGCFARASLFSICAFSIVLAIIACWSKTESSTKRIRHCGAKKSQCEKINIFSFAFPQRGVCVLADFIKKLSHLINCYSASYTK